MDKELTADEMFEKLGYELVDKGYWFLHYGVTDYKKWCKTLDYDYKNEEFYNNKKQVFLFDTINHSFAHIGDFVISMKELKAINKKVEEMGWIK